jgi:hypothetical protein
MPLMMWCKTPGASRQADLGIVPQLSCQTTLSQLNMFKGYIFFDDIVNNWDLKLRYLAINNRIYGVYSNLCSLYSQTVKSGFHE